MIASLGAGKWSWHTSGGKVFTNLDDCVVIAAFCYSESTWERPVSFPLDLIVTPTFLCISIFVKDIPLRETPPRTAKAPTSVKSELVSLVHWLLWRPFNHHRETDEGDEGARLFYNQRLRRRSYKENRSDNNVCEYYCKLKDEVSSASQELSIQHH